MWARNLLFVGLVLIGGLALAAAVLPPSPAVAGRKFAPVQEPDDLRATVEQVDQAFQAWWQASQVEPAPGTDDLVVARRAALGLMGTLPSLQEIRQLESQPGDFLSGWIEAVLADPRFAHYFATRLSRAYVGTADGPFIVFRRRRFVAWLTEQVAKDRPHDQVVREMIATNGLWTDNPATNFISVTIEQGQGKEKDQPNPEVLASRVSRAFLGVRLDCAQCHKHPFESWRQSDFQGLAAFLGQVQSGPGGIHDTGRDYTMLDRKSKEQVVVEPGVPFLEELVPAEGTRRQRLAAWVTHPKNVYFARATVNRVWGIVCGRPLVEPVDGLATAGELPKPLEVLAEDFVAHGYDLKRLIRVIVKTEAFRRDSAAEHELTEAHEKTWAAFPLTRLRPEQIAGAMLQACYVETINDQSHALVRLTRFGGINDFVKRYGDAPEDAAVDRGCTIPQVLLVMNGDLVKQRTEENLFNASTRISQLAKDDGTAVEAAFLAAYSRRPTAEEREHFMARLDGTVGKERHQRMEDIYWALLNSTEFTCNH